MSMGSPRRVWALIGAAGTVVIVALGYLLLISGEKSRQADLDNQSAQVQTQTVTDQNKLALLREDNKKLPEYKEQLAALRKALPLTASTAAFVNDMQRLGNASDVDITAINVAPPTSSQASTPVPATTDGQTNVADPSTGSTTPAVPAASTATQLTMNLTAQGKISNLEHFVNLMQNVEPRALVVTQSTETAAAKSTPTLSLSMTAFVASA